jgi:Holliday junction resolvasome RuvABC DNA-binding subunit
MTMNKIKVTKASIKACIKNGKKMKWKPEKIAETLSLLGFKDEEIKKAM